MAESQNLCAVLHGANDLRIEQRPIDEPGPQEVKIRVRSTGLCGSDLHYFKHGRNGDFCLQAPMCLGHESAGEVVAVGSDVPSSGPKVGERVAIEAGVYCRDCVRCKEGRYNLCKGMRFASSAKTFPHLDGTLQRYMNWPYWGVHSLPDSVSYRSGALMEPLSVVLQGFRRSKLAAGESVLILGAGAVGLLACAAAKASGAALVVAVDIDEHRLSFAKQQGWADATHLLPRSSPVSSQVNGISQDDTRARRQQEDASTIAAAKETATGIVKGITSQGHKLLEDGFDLVLECSGVPSCVQSGIFASRAGGRMVLIGMGTPIQTLPIGAAALREVDILGVFRYCDTYPMAIKLLSQGLLSKEASKEVGIGHVESIVSHSFPLDQAAEAFQTLSRGKSEDGKAAVKVFVEE